MFDSILLPLAILLVMVLFQAWRWIVYFRRKDPRGRNPLITDTNGGRIPGTISTEIIHDGTKFQVESFEGDENFVAYHMLTLIEPSNGDFSIQPAAGSENDSDKSTHFFVFSEDETFDRKYNVATLQTPRFAKSCFKKEEIRKCVEELEALGFCLFRSDGKGFDFVHSLALKQTLKEPGSKVMKLEPYNRKQQKAFDQVAPQAMQAIKSLVERVSEEPIHRIPFGVPESKATWLAMAFPLLLLIANLACIFIWTVAGTIPVRQLDTSGWLILFPPFLVAAFWAWFCYRWFKGRCVIRPVLLTGLLAFFAAVTFPLALMSLNVLLDTNPSQTQLGTIVEVSIRPESKLDKGWDLSYFPNNDPQDVRKLFVSTNRAKEFVLPFPAWRFIKFTTKSGAFGSEYYLEFDMLGKLPEDAN